MSIDSKQLAKQRAERALQLIEQAQNLLGQACEELGPLIGAMKQWDAVGDHYDRTKALWHLVLEGLDWDRLDLDEDTKRRLQRG